MLINTQIFKKFAVFVELKFAVCSQVSTSILRLYQMNATHILTAISLQSAVFKGPKVQ